MSAVKSVLVTGASRGIGEAIARRAAKAGMLAILAARDRTRIDALASSIRADGGRAEPLELDVADPTSIARAVDRLRDRSDPIDALVNNAGISDSAPLGAPGDLAVTLMNVNFFGAVRLIDALLPAMKLRRFGRIVNVASSAGLRGYAYVSAYCASKHALVGYTRAAALELGNGGVSIAAVCPHYVDSPMTDATVTRIIDKTKRTESDVRAFLASQNPGGKLVTADQVATSVLDLFEPGRNGWLVELDGGAPRVIEKL